MTTGDWMKGTMRIRAVPSAMPEKIAPRQRYAAANSVLERPQ
jgi:hypothetical protein